MILPLMGKLSIRHLGKTEIRVLRERFGVLVVEHIFVDFPGKTRVNKAVFLNCRAHAFNKVLD